MNNNNFDIVYDMFDFTDNETITNVYFKVDRFGLPLQCVIEFVEDTDDGLVGGIYEPALDSDDERLDKLLTLFGDNEPNISKK